MEDGEEGAEDRGGEGAGKEGRISVHSLYYILRIDLDLCVSPWYTSLRVATMLDSSCVRMEALIV